MEASLREGLDDVIREIMENINTYSRQRGRVIEYRELLYGYSRVNSMHGHDLILDLLLVYKKYRGKKMTVPVRKHLYVQRSFTETRIREIISNPETAYRDLGKTNCLIMTLMIAQNYFQHKTMRLWTVSPTKWSHFSMRNSMRSTICILVWEGHDRLRPSPTRWKSFSFFPSPDVMKLSCDFWIISKMWVRK